MQETSFNSCPFFVDMENLQRKKLLDKKFKNSFAAFVKYCAEGNIEQIEKTLVNDEIDLNHEYFTSVFNPLYYAGAVNNVEMARTLLKHGAKIKSGSLNQACATGNYEIVEVLIKVESDLNNADRYSYTPLECAITGKHVDIVKLLLENGANFGEDADLRDSDVLEYFCGKVDSKALDIMKLLYDCNIVCCMEPFLSRSVTRGDVAQLWYLIHEGVDVNSTIESDDEYVGFTPLCVACYKGYYDIVELLINCDGDVNLQDRFLNRPLYYAVAGKHVPIVELLLPNNAKYNKCLRNLKSSIISEVFGAIFDKVSLDILKLFLDHNIIDNEQSRETLLHHAVINGDLLLLKFLMDHVTDPDTILKCNGHWTALVLACKVKNHRVIEFLLKSGADPYIQDEHGRTGLTITSDSSVMNALLKFGVDINKQDSNGNTALHRCKDKQVLMLLISLGIDTEIRNNKNKTAWKKFECYQYSRKYGNLLETYKSSIIDICKMKSIVLNKYGLTLHDIFVMNSHELTRYLNNVNLKAILEDDWKFYETFQILGNRLKEKIQQGEERRKLMDEALQFLKNVTGYVIPEPAHFTLFKYFSDGEIKSVFLQGLKE